MEYDRMLSLYNKAESFKKKYHFRLITRCCGTCRHGQQERWNDGKHQCRHPENTILDENEFERYGELSPAHNASFVCDAWEDRWGKIRKKEIHKEG